MRILERTQECWDAAQGLIPAHRPKAIRVFKNGFIEHVFARTHPITPIVWFGPVIGYGIQEGIAAQGAWAALGFFSAGLLLWSMMEYLLHRVIFHGALRNPSAQTPRQRMRGFMIHGYHHEFPSDKMRLVAPPLMSWPLALVTWVLYSALFGARSPVVFAGTATGYIAYDWIHYYTHHFRPSNPVGRWLRSYHLLHHFDDDSHGSERYGVSSPLWDFVFGTYKPVKRPKAPRVRSCPPDVPPPEPASTVT